MKPQIKISAILVTAIYLTIPFSALAETAPNTIYRVGDARANNSHHAAIGGVEVVGGLLTGAYLSSELALDIERNNSSVRQGLVNSVSKFNTPGEGWYNSNLRFLSEAELKDLSRNYRKIYEAAGGRMSKFDSYISYANTRYDRNARTFHISGDHQLSLQNIHPDQFEARVRELESRGFAIRGVSAGAAANRLISVAATAAYLVALKGVYDLGTSAYRAYMLPTDDQSVLCDSRAATPAMRCERNSLTRQILTGAPRFSPAGERAEPAPAEPSTAAR